MRADLHVHSVYSTRPTVWLLQKIGCPESFTDPETVYRLAQARGMDLVTITDHNAIEGALQIAELPGVFVSEEVTAYFPEDRCKVHVLAYDISEQQHREIQRLRRNLFELVPWLREQGIVHALAHPLFSVNHMLSAFHVEQLLLLFGLFECNGARDDAHNDLVRRILESLTPELLVRLADRHGIDPEPVGLGPRVLVGGSDDHSGLHIARLHTRVRGADSVAGFLAGVSGGEALVEGHGGCPTSEARNFYSIAWRFYRSRFGLERHVGASPLLEFIDRALTGEEAQESGMLSRAVQAWRQRRRARSGKPKGGQGLVLFEAEELVLGNETLRGIARGESCQGLDLEDTLFDFVNEATNRVAVHFVRSVIDQVSLGNVFSLFDTLGSAGSLYTLLSPYFVAYSIDSRVRQETWRLERHFLGDRAQQAPRDIRVAHFTDTLMDINGVALTMRENARIAAETGRRLTVLACHDGESPSLPGIRHVKPIAVHALPEYPDQKLAVPSFLELLRYCAEQEFTHVHLATPGPMGLAGLAVARVLDLPVAGTYHTRFPQYVCELTGDKGLEDLTWRLMTWFYEQLDAVYCPSREIRDELVSRGLRPERVLTYPRGVDTRRFSPAHSGDVLERHFGVDRDSVRLLYVGRVSKEKNLPLLCEVFRRLHAGRPDVCLTVVGEGPWLTEMKAQLAGCRCYFTGHQDGDVLGEIFASCDLFVFPSTTDTFGKVVLESQASGLPVVVTDQGGPMENVVAGETGVIVPGGDADALLRALYALVTDRERLKSMGQAARRYAETRSVVGAFEAMWQLWREQPRRPPRGEQGPHAAQSNVFMDGPFAGAPPFVQARR